MRKNLLPFFILIIVILFIPLLAFAAAPSPTPTPIISVTPSATPFLGLTPSPEKLCRPIPIRLVPLFANAIDDLLNSLDVKPLLDFFNLGGTADTLQTALTTAGNEFVPYLSQVIAQDINGDGIPEIFLAITAATDTDLSGDSQLLMFTCIDGFYQNTILFRRAGAGDAGEGLYEGGGAHILSLADLNANGLPDLLIAVDRRDAFGESAQYFLSEWDGKTFQPIITFQDPLIGTLAYVPSNTIGGLTITDTDNDGIDELVVDGVAYRWDDKIYRAD